MHTIHLQHILPNDRVGIRGSCIARGLKKLSAFLIIEIVAVNHPELYARYRDRVAPILAAAGGTYVVRGGDVEVLEGRWQPNRMVVVRFDSRVAARGWWKSSGYAELKAMRQGATTTNMILVEGVSNA
jgi:uncharacterized protein (DUF1330 family)